MGESDFFTSTQYLCVDKEALIQDESLLASLTNFQVLMKVLEQSENKMKKENMITLLLLLFPDRKAAILPNNIILACEELPPVSINDSNFEAFQDVVKRVLCLNSMFQGDNVIYNPANAAAKAIADKLMAGRRKVAQLKGEQNNSNQSILTRYLSILEVAKIVSPDKSPDLTLFQVFDLIERYSAYVEWDVDQKLRLAGGKPEKTVDNWMRDLYSNQTQAYNSGGMSDQIKTYKK